jgi:4-amino-4-deoxy-L-arabinose transferase-like glycosyltransferase
LIVVALAARVGWAAWIAHAEPDAVRSGDTPGYLGPARALIDSGRFSYSPQDDTPMFLRTPGYPALLAVILWATDSEWAISPVQAALSASVVVLVVLVGRKVIGTVAALVAGAIVALDPLQFALSGTILSETLASFTLLAVAAAGTPVFLRPPDRVRPLHVAALGALLAVATFVRPTTYYLPPVLAVLLAARLHGTGWRRTVAYVVAFLVPVAVAFGAWHVRNERELGTSQFSGSQAVTLYCWHAAEVRARVDGVSIGAARERLGCHRGGWDDLASSCPSWWDCDSARPLADGAGWDEMSRRGIDILRDNPVESAEVYVRGLVREVAGPGTDTVRRFLDTGSSPALVAALFSWNALLWSLAAVGAAVGLRSSRQRWYWAFVITLIVYVLLVSGGANSGARFRAPLVPLLALLAALGLRALVLRLAGRDRDVDAALAGRAPS